MANIGIAKTQVTVPPKSSGGGSSAFNAITTGTNTTATMTVGTGASITTSGTGQVNATQVQQIGVASSNPTGNNVWAYDSTNFVWAQRAGIFMPVAAALAALNKTAQTGNTVATTILAVPSSGAITAGFYTFDARIIVSQAASSSSTMPDTQLIYTDADSGATITVNLTSSSAGNTTSTFAQATHNFYAKAGTNIQIAIGQVSGYASTGATAMQFSYRGRLTYKT